MQGIVGECPEQRHAHCATGQHPRSNAQVPEVPDYWSVFTCISRTKMQLLQVKWNEAGGMGQLQAAWQVRNKRLDKQFRATAHNLAMELGCASDMIDGWHGTAEQNVYSIAQHGFDTGRRCGQAYGAGEYFAKDPTVSVGYAKGGAFMFLCKLLLGAEGTDHTWVNDMKYYVVKQRNQYVQALPVYLVQFQYSCGEVVSWLSQVSSMPQVQDEGTLQYRQRGGQSACEARRDAGMAAATTTQLWVGWLAPELGQASDDAIHDDVCRFLHGVQISEVIPERNGARVGAHVLLTEPLTKAAFDEVASRRYRGKFRISVDDGQPQNPRCAGKACPRLTGPSGYCRGWNLAGHRAWQWSCPFEHPLDCRPTHGVTFSVHEVAPKSAIYDQVETSLLQSAPFHNGQPQLIAVHRIVNPVLEKMYEQRRNFLTQKHGFTVEKELWHGTNCLAIPELLTHGLQPPSDTRPSESCPRSGGKGLCTSLCGTDCKHCKRPHNWDKCHMYGLGVYLADMAQKSHRYVREPERRTVATGCVDQGVGACIRGLNGELWGRVTEEQAKVWILESGRVAKKETQGVKWQWEPAPASRGVGVGIRGIQGDLWGNVVAEEPTCWRLDSGRIAKKETEGCRWNWEPSAQIEVDVYCMLFCRVCLGNPYLIEGNLLAPSGMHDMCWCQDPSEQLETVAEEWSHARGHDTFFVRGLNGAQRAGLGVYNSEYIVFQPFQVLPLYRVDYMLH